MQERYSRNIPAISEEEQLSLFAKKVLVVGCGGLGGFIIEFLSRLGVGTITAVDGDCFEPSNLNRQILSGMATLGKSKAIAARERVANVNPEVEVHAVQQFFSAENADMLVEGQDLVVDALDNVAARLLLEDTCEKYGITLVHGAICGWNAQVAVVRPGSRILHSLYGNPSAVFSKTSLPFTPPFCASLEVAEAVKLLCGRPSELMGKLLLADMRTMSFSVLDLE